MWETIIKGIAAGLHRHRSKCITGTNTIPVLWRLRLPEAELSHRSSGIWNTCINLRRMVFIVYTGQISLCHMNNLCHVRILVIHRRNILIRRSRQYIVKNKNKKQCAPEEGCIPAVPNALTAKEESSKIQRNRCSDGNAPSQQNILR